MEVNNEGIVKKFFSKFIVNYIVSVFLIGFIFGFLVEMLSAILPEYIVSIINFIGTSLVLWKVSTTTVDMSLHEAPITPEDVGAAKKKVYMFFIILIAIYSVFNIVMGLIGEVDFIVLLFSVISLVLQYVAMMVFCKDRIDQSVLSKQPNKWIYLIILAAALGFICVGAVISNLL